MGVSTTNAISGPFTANGVTTVFPFTFTAPTESEVEVRLVDADGVETVANVDDYTVVRGGGSGGSVTFATAPASGYEVYILLAPEFTQNIEFENGSAWLARPVNEGYDRSASRDQWLKARLEKLAPDGLLTGGMASKFLAFDASGNPVASSGTGADAGLREDLAATSGANLIRGTLAGFPSINKTLGDALPYINPGEFFGINSAGSDDSAALALAIDAVANNSRHDFTTLQLKPGGLTVTETEIALKSGVRLDIAGGELQGQFAGGNDVVLRILSNTMAGNGKISVASTGSPGSQASAHACILVGERYGAQDSNGDYYTPENRSPYDGVRDFVLWNLGMISDKDLGPIATGGAAAFAAQGDVARGLVAFCRVLASSKMSIGFGVDWSEIGGNADGTAQGINSAAAQMANNLANFTAGRALTTHPHDLHFWHCIVEALSRPYDAGAGATSGTFGFRFSGAYRISAEHCTVHATTEAALAEHAGDLGAEFAADADYQAFFDGHEFKNCSVLEGSTSYAIQSDDQADNIVTAQSTFQLDASGNPTVSYYTPQRGTYFPSQSLWRRISARCTAGASANTGLYCFDKHGGRFEDITMSGFKIGARFSDAHDVVLQNARISFSREENVLIEDDSSNVTILNPEKISNANRGAGGKHNVRVSTSQGVKLIGGHYGDRSASESAVHNIVLVNGEAEDVYVDGVTIHSAASGGIGLIAGADAPGGPLALIKDVTYGAFLSTTYFGQRAKPVSRDGMVVYEADSGAVLTGLAVNAGDEIKYTNPAAGGFRGQVVTTAGLVGSTATTKTWGAISA